VATRGAVPPGIAPSRTAAASLFPLPAARGDARSESLRRLAACGVVLPSIEVSTLPSPSTARLPALRVDALPIDGNTWYKAKVCNISNTY
jgi:hypothetical protein